MFGTQDTGRRQTTQKPQHTQKTKKIRHTDSTNKHEGEHMSSRRVSNSYLLLDTQCATRIVKFSKNHIGDKGNNTFYIKKQKIHRHLINGYFLTFIKFVRAMHEQHVPY
jgi:hypothetical protein